MCAAGRERHPAKRGLLSQLRDCRLDPREYRGLFRVR